MEASVERHRDPDWFHRKVEQCRSLAGSSIDPHVAAALKDLAEELEAHAATAERIAAETARDEDQ